MTRPFSGTFRMRTDARYTDEVPLVFAALTHPNLTVPISIVADTKDYIYNSVTLGLGSLTYTGFPFDLELPQDSDKAPRGRITIQNVDRRVGQAIQELIDSPTLMLEVIAASDFDLTVNPRTALATPKVQYGAYFLRLQKVSVDPLNISADITSWDLSSEPWPYIRTTQDTLPGLFRR